MNSILKKDVFFFQQEVFVFFFCIQGQEIDLSRKPNEIDYIIDALRNQLRPVLFLCRELVS